MTFFFDNISQNNTSAIKWMEFQPYKKYRVFTTKIVDKIKMNKSLTN